eukprot:TRINITY_DN20889_c0_g1_i2.p1 TRINITY_DN20889_c0_g1~~TRINITY_DN20889_c0_g1_i2.p1  ORF type:complete len:195 (-),score=43.87 TRINITY_DN20889_c0_g1_i2:132-716(-)
MRQLYIFFFLFFFLMIRRPPRSTQGVSSAASDVYKRQEFFFKLIMIGSKGVGKTNLVSRFVYDEFKSDYETTLGVDFISIKHNIMDQFVDVQIWDTSGEEKFKSLTSIYFRGAHGVILVYDSSRSETFKDICDIWMKEIKENVDPNARILLLGNKCDLQSNHRISADEARAYACLLYTSPSPRDLSTSRMPSSA